MIFTHVCELQLSFNKLAHLPGELGSLIHLTVLDLRYIPAVVFNVATCWLPHVSCDVMTSLDYSKQLIMSKYVYVYSSS